MNLNKVMLIGRLGKDPEIRQTANGAVANFTIATSEVYKDKNGQRQELTDWHNIVMWRYNAENAEKLLRKGKLVYIEGKLKTRSWDDKDGNKRYTTEVNADSFILLDRDKREDGDSYSGGYQNREYSQQSDAQSPVSPPADVPAGGSDDDLPF
jgi:single-strand DNA-binding protein